MPGADLALIIDAGGDLMTEEALLGGIPICRARCAAESQLTFVSGPGDDAAIRHGTVGRPNPAMSARAVNDNGEIVETG